IGSTDLSDSWSRGAVSGEPSCARGIREDNTAEGPLPCPSAGARAGGSQPRPARGSRREGGPLPQDRVHGPGVTLVPGVERVPQGELQTGPCLEDRLLCQSSRRSRGRLGWWGRVAVEVADAAASVLARGREEFLDTRGVVATPAQAAWTVHF